jgi:acetyltransferase-like isoleucine patch superfamily enzyme
MQPIHAVGRGKISCSGVTVGLFSSPLFFSSYAYFEARHPSASIKIGRGTYINNNISIISESAGIVIGQDCLIGANVEILDSDFHALRVEDRRLGARSISESVNIGNDVFIGANVKIMKGVSIGDGSTIANGSIVTRDIPSKVVAGGVPAKVLRSLQ